MYIQYDYYDWNPTHNSLVTIDNANAIIKQFQAEGYTLTLRQLYYQFVANNLIENTDRNYNKIKRLVTKARMAGLISWDAIEDRHRKFNHWTFEENETELIRNLRNKVIFDLWNRQDTYLEVWVEKEALGNVIEKACDPYRVPHMACKGYLSASEAWRAGIRFKDKIDNGKECIVIHLGDHDPSGIDMTRDNQDRIDIFTENMGVEVRRIALNYNQVEEYSPPPNPTKLTDTRAGKYLAKYGKTSWELDALKPQVMVDLIQDQIKSVIDIEQWNGTKDMEEELETVFDNLYDKWDEIREKLME